jgi:Tol biopolymer transport system component
VKVWLALLGTLPLLAVGSGATAGNSAPPRNGLIAVRGSEGITLVDPRTGSASVVPGTETLAQPAWSPDATLLAVTSFAGESSVDSVYTMKPNGSERTLVLRNASMASWSPDGKQLVVVAATQLSTSLAIVKADGTDARILKGTAEASGPKWSPDGKLIAFDDSNGRVALITPEGEPVAMPTKVEAAGVSWSPDSSKLAYDGYRGNEETGHGVVVVLDLASGRATTLPGSEGASETPTWSPEGDQIAFEYMPMTSTSSKCGSGWELAVTNVEGSGARSSLLRISNYSSPSWGRAIAAVPTLTSAPTKISPTKKASTPAMTSTPNVAPIPTSNPSVAPTPTVAPKPKPSRVTAARTATSSEPVQGANGLIAVRGKGGIYLVDPSAARSQEISGTARMWAPAWSATMKELAVQKAEKGGGSSVYTIKPDGTHAQLVLENASAPSWSPAGDRIFAVRNECTGPCDSEDDAANVLYTVNADGTGAQRVDLDDSDAYRSRELAWPVDGTSIHFFDDESLSGPGSFDSSAATWSPDETQLAFTGALGPSEDESESNGLWIVSAEGGTPTLLLSNAVGRPSWAR